MNYFYNFAASNEYNDGAYGTSTYNGESSQQVTDPGTEDGGPLAYTGYDVILPVALGIAIVGASVILLVKKLRRKQA